MHTTSHKEPAHKDINELSKKLQHEINTLLSNVDEKMMYSEFRESEMFDIQNGDKTEIVRHTLDERISMGRTPPRTIAAKRLEQTTLQAAQKISGASRIFHYLLKPLQY